MTEHDGMQMRHDLFAAAGLSTDLADVMRAISVSARLAAEKLEKIGGTLTRIAVRVGSDGAEEEDGE